MPEYLCHLCPASATSSTQENIRGGPSAQHDKWCANLAGGAPNRRTNTILCHRKKYRPEIPAFRQLKPVGIFSAKKNRSIPLLGQSDFYKHDVALAYQMLGYC